MIAGRSKIVHHGAAAIDENLLRVRAVEIYLTHFQPLSNATVRHDSSALSVSSPSATATVVMVGRIISGLLFTVRHKHWRVTIPACRRSAAPLREGPAAKPPRAQQSRWWPKESTRRTRRSWRPRSPWRLETSARR